MSYSAFPLVLSGLPPLDPELRTSSADLRTYPLTIKYTQNTEVMQASGELYEVVLVTANCC